MRPAPLVIVALTALAGVALAQELVESGLRLAAEDDPVKRAEACGGLADTFAQEVRLATAAKDSARALDLGRDLQGLLRGLAANLKQAFIDRVTGLAANDAVPFTLDYWRLNMQARKP